MKIGAQKTPYAGRGARASGFGWLARHQEADGRWDARTHGGMGDDTYVTGLAAWAFQVNGHSAREGEYKETVSRAIDRLISQQSENGRIGNASGDSVNHAVCGIALCHAYCHTANYSLEHAKPIKRAAQRAIDYSCSVLQTKGGEWAVKPAADATLAATELFVIQLKLASSAQLNVPEDNWSRVRRFLESVGSLREGSLGRCSNRPGEEITPQATASGLVCWQLLGRKRTDPMMQAGAEYLLGHLPEWKPGKINYRYWHSGAHVCFIMGGRYWKAWNGAMRDMLIGHQVAEGDGAGSWEPVGIDCGCGGRVHSTAVGCLCFKFYYRYFPIGPTGEPGYPL